MSNIERFEDIEAWMAARQLRPSVYRLTKTKPFAADFALVDQIRRAAISPGSNIAEGFERGGNREFIQFLSVAKGSVGEIKDQLYCALDESCLTRMQFEETHAQAETTPRLIGGIITYLRQTVLTGPKFTRASPATNKPEVGNLQPASDRRQ